MYSRGRCELPDKDGSADGRTFRYSRDPGPELAAKSSAPSESARAPIRSALPDGPDLLVYRLMPPPGSNPGPCSQFQRLGT